MALNTGLLAELKQETENSRKMLERIPMDKLSWKPHEKSMTIEQLSKHIANLPTWISMALLKNELDFAKGYTPVPDFKSTEELISQLNKNTEEALKALEQFDDAHFLENWTLRNGDHIILTMKRIAIIRGLAMNHMIHHRGQLSVYLRMLDIPVPGIYGPSADEKN
ncbi:MAG: DinB family protein [Bacteroidia bacterium]